jgi:hypothetical protein
LIIEKFFTGRRERREVKENLGRELREYARMKAGWADFKFWQFWHLWQFWQFLKSSWYTTFIIPPLRPLR